MIGFPEELIERCAKKLEQYGPQYSAEEKVWAILRESGHAELAAALKLARPYVHDDGSFSALRIGAVLEQIDAALKKAGAL